MQRIFLGLALLLGAPTALADCTFDLEVGDSLQFSVPSIEAATDCTEVTINLEHTGQLPAAAMGHNWVLSKETDLQGIAMDGVQAGLAGNYLNADDSRVIAATKIIGGGESTSVSFTIEGMSADESYVFFCSFPGHWSVMKGTFKLVG